MPDIPIKNEDDFSKDIVQAVDKIASEVASASSEFTKSFNGLTASIQAMQNAVVGAINQLKININNNFKTTSSTTRTKKENFGPTRKEFEAEQKRIFDNAKKGMPGFVGPISPYTEKPSKEEYGPTRKDFEQNLKEIFESTKPGMTGFVGPQTPYVVKTPKEEYGPTRKDFEEELLRVFENMKPGQSGFQGPQTPYTFKPPKEEYGPTRKDFEAELKRLNEEAKPGRSGFQGPQTPYIFQPPKEEYGPTRELYEEFGRISESGRNFSDSLIQMTDSVLSSVPVFGKIFKILTSGPLVALGVKMMRSKAQYKSDGGDVFKPKGTDTTPAMLTPGEFVINKDSAKKNKSLLEAINNGKAKGGSIGYFSSGGGVGYYAGGGTVASSLLGVATSAVGMAINSFTKSIEIASTVIGSFSSALAKSNPATMEQVNLVFNDLQGVIGRGLNPVIQAIIPVLRYFADFVDSIVKNIKPIIDQLTPIITQLTVCLIDLSKSILDSVIPIFKMILPVITELLNILIPIVKLLTSLASVLGGLINAISGPISAVVSGAVGLLGKVVNGVTSAVSFIGGSLVAGFGKITSWVGNVVPGLKGFGEATIKAGAKIAGVAKGQKPDVGIQKGSSFGAAVRDVQSLSISGIGDELRKSALMGGANQVTQEQLLENINKKLEKNALADAFAQGIAKEKGKRIPEPNNFDPDIAPGEFPGAWDMPA